MAEGSSSNLYPGRSSEKWPVEAQAELLGPTENKNTSGVVVKQEVELDDLVGSGPSSVTGFPATGSGDAGDDFSSCITDDLFGVITSARQTLTHQSEADPSFMALCSDSPAPPPPADAAPYTPATHYPHNTNKTPTVNSLLHITGDNVNVFLDCGINSLQYSTVSSSNPPSYSKHIPAGHSSFSPYSTNNLTNNASTCPSAYHFSDSRSSGYSSNSPSAYSSTSDSSCTTSSPGVEALYQDVNSYYHSQYPRYHSSSLPHSHYHSYYGQMSGTSTHGAQSMCHYVAPGSDISRQSNSTYYMPTNLNRDQLPLLCDTKPHRAKSSSPSDTLDGQLPNLNGSRRDLRNNSSSPAPSKETVPHAFRSPHAVPRPVPPAVSNNGPLSLFSHPHGSYYSYDPIMFPASLPRVGENININPPSQTSKDDNAYLDDFQANHPGFLSITPRTNVSVHITRSQPSPLPVIPHVSVPSQISSQSSSSYSSPSTLPMYSSHPLTFATSASTPGTRSTSDSQMVQIPLGSIMQENNTFSTSAASPKTLSTSDSQMLQLSPGTTKQDNNNLATSASSLGMHVDSQMVQFAPGSIKQENNTFVTPASSPVIFALSDFEMTQIPSGDIKQENTIVRRNQFHQQRVPSRVFNPGLKTTCEECGVTVASTGHLERHKGAHGADRRFRCPVCNCSFSRKDNLHNHLARAHGIGEVTPRNYNNKRKKLKQC